jgi:hypothetical protein
MNEFFRFPHTPHLLWLGAGSPRDDKVLSLPDAGRLIAGEVVVEEKLDGANLGFSVGSDGRLRVQNRGQYLAAPYSGQFSRLTTWIGMHENTLVEMLGLNLILFGEWCAACHSLDYADLPDWFLAFDVYDTSAEKFWSTAKRNQLVSGASIAVVPSIFKGETSLAFLKSLLVREPSRFRGGTLEGIIVRKESRDWLEARAKLVQPDFTQNITEHWSRRGIKWNRLRKQEALHS